MANYESGLTKNLLEAPQLEEKPVQKSGSSLKANVAAEPLAPPAPVAPPAGSASTSSSTSSKVQQVGSMRGEWEKLAKKQEEKASLDQKQIDAANERLKNFGSYMVGEERTKFEAAHEKLNKEYEKNKNILAWIDAATTLAQIAVKFMAAQKSLKDGRDYASGVKIDSGRLSDHYKRLEDRFDKDIAQFNREKGFSEERATQDVKDREKNVDRLKAGAEDFRARGIMSDMETQQFNARERASAANKGLEAGNLTDVQRAQIQLLERDADALEAKLAPQINAVETALEIAKNPQETHWFTSDKPSKEQIKQLEAFKQSGIDIGALTADPAKYVPELEKRLDMLRTKRDSEVGAKRQQVRQIVGIGEGPAPAAPAPQSSGTTRMRDPKNNKEADVPNSRVREMESKGMVKV